MLGLAIDSGTIRKWCHLDRPSLKVRPCREEPYLQGGVEPRLGDLLNDPMTRAILRCDGVSPNALRALIDDVRTALNSQQSRM
jgi:hypothetical protein